MSGVEREVTVIVPTYNRAGLLGETLESVLSQDASLRIVVIDDGSTDATDELLGSYRRDVTWIKQPNRGEVRTVNRGLRLVDTPFFAVVNSDDPLLPGSLRRMIDALYADSDALAAYCDWLVIDETSRPLGEVRVGPLSFDTMMFTDNNPVGPGAVFRSRILDDVGLRDPLLKYSADLDYWHRVALLGDIVYVPEILATHRVHSASASVAERGLALSSEVMQLRASYASHPRWLDAHGRTPTSYARRRLAIAAGHFSAAFAATSQRAAGRHLMRAFQMAPFRALDLIKAQGPSTLAAVISSMDGVASGKGALLLEDALHCPNRWKGVRMLTRAMLSDPCAVLNAMCSIDLETIRSRLQSMPIC